ncbi:hypothetical protein [Marinimicrobium sp. ARAG 43.8]|uniref:hypothetical protein n=1 Tax=Marinimicrobium sp. ARAG 43.8 TaxID=3418719 RepID=UPI003CECE45F
MQSTTANAKNSSVFLASIIKVDIEQTPLAQAVAKRRQFRHLPLRWLAERVKTVEGLEKRLAMKQNLDNINRTLLELYQHSAHNVQALFNELP